VGLEFELRCSTTWTTPPDHFCSGYFGDGILWTVSPGWPQTAILPISASQIARITGTSHQRFFILFFFIQASLIFRFLWTNLWLLLVTGVRIIQKSIRSFHSTVFYLLSLSFKQN
jgi:hypothetical protein